MPKTPFILGLTFVGVFGAGAVTALVVDRYARVPKLPPPSALRTADPPGRGNPGNGPRSYIAERLKLTPEQHEQMDRLWNATREQIAQYWAQRRALQQERDEALRGLLTDAQRQTADEIIARYDAKIAELREATDALMRDADRRTREMLTPEQQARYDQMQRERLPREEGGRGRGPGGPGPGPHGPGGERRSPVGPMNPVGPTGPDAPTLPGGGRGPGGGPR